MAATARKSAINTLALYSRFFCNVSNAVRFCGDPDSLTDVVQIAGFKRAVYVGRNIFVIGVGADRRSRFFCMSFSRKKADFSAGPFHFEMLSSRGHQYLPTSGPPQR